MNEKKKRIAKQFYEAFPKEKYPHAIITFCEDGTYHISIPPKLKMLVSDENNLDVKRIKRVLGDKE